VQMLEKDWDSVKAMYSEGMLEEVLVKDLG